MNIKKITDPAEKQKITRIILEALPEWFEIAESREAYIRESAAQPMFAAFADAQPVGFICLKQTGDVTAEIAVTGVRKEYHRQGIGKAIFEAAKQYAAAAGFRFLQVKTVRMGMYPEYDRTNRFYLGVGFREFEVLPLWDEANPCQIYIMGL